MINMIVSSVLDCSSYLTIRYLTLSGAGFKHQDLAFRKSCHFAYQALAPPGPSGLVALLNPNADALFCVHGLRASISKFTWIVSLRYLGSIIRNLASARSFCVTGLKVEKLFAKELGKSISSSPVLDSISEKVLQLITVGCCCANCNKGNDEEDISLHAFGML